MIRLDLDIEKALLIVADMHLLENARDKLSRIVSVTLSGTSNDYGEISEMDLNLVCAAALPSYQQFLRNNEDRL